MAPSTLRLYRPDGSTLRSRIVVTTLTLMLITFDHAKRDRTLADEVWILPMRSMCFQG